jgi:penicillin-binding protein 1C
MSERLVSRLGIAFAALLLSGTTAVAGDSADGAVSFEQVRSSYRPSETLLLDRQGRELDRVRTDPRVRRLEWVKLEELSPAFRRALLLSEDRRFLEHSGVDWLALTKAALTLPFAENPRGASTISMQLVGLLAKSGSRRRSVTGKLKQIRAALALEKTWSKEQVLEAYLNLIWFRGELQGLRAVSEGVFGKSPHGLTESEAVLLAVLVRAPNAPPERVAERACGLAREMTLASSATLSCEKIREQALAILQAGYRIEPRERLAPVLAAQLASKGSSDGAVIATTLDRDIQRIAVSALKRQVVDLRSRNVTDGAALVVDVATGDVLAYVANAGAHASARFVDGVQAARQLGSTLKPFLYAHAIEQRLLTSASLLDDSPAEFQVSGGGVYRPRNHDERFHGLVPLDLALGSSLNVPAVRTLDLVGVEAFMRTLAKLGFTSLQRPDFYGHSLALGSVDASLWELTQAYRVLANGGSFSAIRHEPSHFVRASRATRTRSRRQRVFSAGTAAILTDVLSDREARHLSFGLENPLALRSWAAVKTGTSKDMRDNWCVGFNDRYVVGVWVGNFSGAPMHDVSGVTGAAPAWAEIMSQLQRRAPARRAPTLSRAAKAQLVKAEVVLPALSSPTQVSEPRPYWFLKGTAPENRARVELARHLPKIRTPARDLIAAIDPDIPDDHQRLLFQTQGETEGLLWSLNEQVLGAASEPYAWKPEPGLHRLKLVTAAGQVADEVRFEVR